MPETVVADTLMESFVIEGGRPLRGSIRAAGNKNAALADHRGGPPDGRAGDADERPRHPGRRRPCSTSSPTSASRSRSSAAASSGSRREDVRKHELDAELCTRIRASILLAGPLLARWGEAVVPAARRRRDRATPPRHAHPRVRAARRRDRGRPAPAHEGRSGSSAPQVFLDEASVTGTENAVMAAALAEGETTIVNAACEPHVQDLCRFLVALGARIEGIGSNVLSGPGRRPPRRRRVAHLPRPHRGGELHRPRRRHRGRDRDRGRRPGAHGRRLARLRAPRRRMARRRGARSACRAARSS